MWRSVIILNTREIGNKYEDKSVEFLIKNSYKILERNYQNKFGEIDIIAQKDDEIVSIAEYMQVFNKKSLFLYGISTLKKYRNQGFASFLLDETEKILKSLGFEEIELTVDPQNIIAINLYKHHGYTMEKFLEDEYGKNVHRYMMKKVINHLTQIKK